LRRVGGSRHRRATGHGHRLSGELPTPGTSTGTWLHDGLSRKTRRNPDGRIVPIVPEPPAFRGNAIFPVKGLRSGVLLSRPGSTILLTRQKCRLSRLQFDPGSSFLERWLSGRKHRFAKAAWGLNLTPGSNPGLSVLTFREIPVELGVVVNRQFHPQKMALDPA
jgi:hypothetical protein